MGLIAASLKSTEPIVLTGLSATAKAIDLSNSGIGPNGNWFYMDGGNRWQGAGFLYASVITGNVIVLRDRIETENSGQFIKMLSYATDNSTSVAYRFGNRNVLATAGAKIAVFYNDSTTTERAIIDKDGAIYPTVQGNAKPTADATYRNAIWVERGGVGVADKVYICLKSAADTYSWVQIATG